MEVKELFCVLLRDALWGSITPLDVSKDQLLKVIKLAKAQTVLGLIANEILKREELASLFSLQYRDRLNYFVQGNFYNSQKQNGSLATLVLKLREQGIDPILLKGQGVARNYPMPELRQCGDLDIYVGPENYAKACEMVSAMSNEGESHKVDEDQKHYHTKVGHAYIEVHQYTDVYYPKRLNNVYQKISDEGLNKGLVPLDFCGVKVLTPTADFNAFFIFNHFWHHFVTDGVGLRHLCDWTLLLHANYGKLDEAFLADSLCKMKMMKQWKVFGCIAVDYLELPHEEMPFYDAKYRKLAGRVLDLMLKDGNFGHENQKKYHRPKGYLSGKFYSFFKRSGRNLRVFRLFPKEAVVQTYRMFTSGIATIFKEKFSK